MRKAAPFIAAISLMSWAGAGAALAATPAPRLLRSDVSAQFGVRPATMSFGCCGRLIITGTAVTGSAFRSGQLGAIRWYEWGSRRSAGDGRLWIDNCVPSCTSGRFQPRPVSIQASDVVNGRFTRLLLIYRLGTRWVFDRRTLERAPAANGPAYQWFAPSRAGQRAPNASTTGASPTAPSTAAVTGIVNPNSESTSYYFQYGPTPEYGSTTQDQAAGSGSSAVNVSASLGGLDAATTYHYRVAASNAWGTTYGPDRTFTTFLSAQTNANRALETYDAMQQYFYSAYVYPGDASSLYTENYPQSGRTYSYLWPFSQAMAGTITLSGVPSALVGTSYQTDVADRLTGLSRYWDSTSTGPGYDSYPAAPYGGGGAKYYDDQAWVGLAAAQNYAITGDSTSLGDAENAFNFVYPGGWAGGASFDPGGIYWVQQGVGLGKTNHRRMAVSNAPNAELGLVLANYTGDATYASDANRIYQWINHYLYNVNANPTDPMAPNPNYDSGQPGLMFAWITTQNTIDETLFPTAQGSMIAANVLDYRATGDPSYLSDAEAIANAALSTFNESYYLNQPTALDATFFRGLLVLYAATTDTTLQSNIMQTIQTFAEDAWNSQRGPNGLFYFPSSAQPGYQLLDQAAMLRIYSMLAWNPSDYANLP
jgi:glycosyl hydrolase family 76